MALSNSPIFVSLFNLASSVISRLTMGGKSTARELKPTSRASPPSQAEPNGVPPAIFTPICHPLVDSVSKEVDDYFLEHWKFDSEKSKKRFLGAGFSKVTCLYFPKALDDRIHFACRLLTVLFLIDGKFTRL
jgi:hypothetical protein